MAWHISANISGFLVFDKLVGADSKLVTMLVVFGAAKRWYVCSESNTFIGNGGAGNGANDYNVCGDSTKRP